MKKKVLCLVISIIMLVGVSSALVTEVCAVTKGDGTFIWPVSTSISISGDAYYYINGEYVYHGATDFGCGVGTAVYATAAGKVVTAIDCGCKGSHYSNTLHCSLDSACKALQNGMDYGGYANYIIIDHENGFYSLYAHLSTGSFLVSTGDRVSQGQQIARSGAAGYTDGAHLHFELRKGSNTYAARVDPQDYLTKTNTPFPSNVILTANKTSYAVGETATFSFSSENATHYSFVLINGYSFEEGVTAKYVVNQTAGTQTFTFTEPGIYKTWACAFNGSSYVNSPFSYLVVGSDEPVKTAEYGNSRYELYIGKTDWESAEAFCEEKGGHLVTITSDEEWETVLRLIQEKPYSVESVWIGLADKDHDGTYSWISGEPFACNHWAEGNPSITGGKEHYTEMGVVSGEWNDIELNGINVPVTHEQHWRTSGYICEYDHLKHDYEVVSSVSPTCTEDGNINYICSECGETYTETVPALGHNFGKDGKSEKCSRCGVTNPDYKPLTGFKDVIAGEFYVEPVAWAVNNGITSGTSDTTFSPNDGCTRGQVVTFLWRSAGKPEPKISVNPFSDVKSSEYYYKAVLWAVENGITNGTSASKFSPNDTCTRGQIVTFLWRAKGSPEPKSTNNPFSDIGKKDYYFKAVLWAVGKNITLGTDKNHFSPSDTCTRAQVVTFFYRGKN